MYKSIFLMSFLIPCRSVDILNLFSLLSIELGEILAKQLAALGAKLILSARNEAELQRVKNQLMG